MSGQVFDVGSVVQFYPGKESVRLVRSDNGSIFRLESQGWVSVVVDRDGWSVTTAMDVLVPCCSSWVPGVWHFNEKHQGHKDGEKTWRLELTRDGKGDQ